MLPTLILIGVCAVTGSIAAAVWYVLREKSKAKAETLTEFRSALLQQLQKRGPASINLRALAEEHEVPEDAVAKTTEELFRATCKSAYQDAIITSEERRYLDALRDAFRMPMETAERIEASQKAARYRQAVGEFLADGIISAEENAALALLRKRFGLSNKKAAQIVGSAGTEGYIALFREVIQDGRITPEELEQLKNYRDAFNMSRAEANELIRKDALSLYRRWSLNIVQDGDVTAEEEQGLAWLRKEFDLDSADTMRYDQQVKHAKQLAAYRRGDLPTFQTRKLLERNETCHWECPCRFEWKTATQTKGASGELVVTSNRFVFTSSLRSFSFSPSKVVDVVLYTNALSIKTSSNRGSGTYFLDESGTLEAIVFGLVRRHKLLTASSGFSSDRSRRIPDAVRREVFIRDGGKCVQCGSDYPLHYDHILPYSKGGGNTVENIQILCGPCNIRKSDNI